MDPIVGQASAWALDFSDTFITHDANGNYVGKVADSWDVSPDGATWTFHLHPGIKFQNGDPMTAQDVLFSLQHFGDKASTNPWSPYIIADAADITAPDDNTVVYKLKAPEWAIREPISQTVIMPKNYYNQVGKDGWAKAPIGLGAYKMASYTPKTSITFQAVPNYWGKVKPQFATVVETLVPDEATRMAQLQRGEADIITNINLDNQAQLKSQGYKLVPFGLPTQTN
ncbi:MAG TPA: ABC transporter substrate-binding protein, partial [Chloroflexota bacterium]|nr:ABC transporter substrate-binding protein [Chloroflexota bacterium]